MRRSHRLGVALIIALLASNVFADESTLRFAAVVTDDVPYHVHEPGKPLEVEVMPAVVAGPTLTWNVANLELRPGAKPYATEGWDQLAGRLLGEKPSREGVTFDFFNVAQDKRTLDVVLTFKTPVLLTGLTLAGDMPNGQFNVARATVQLLHGDDSQSTEHAALVREGNDWRVVFGHPPATWVKSATIKLDVPYKVKLTQLVAQGRPRDRKPDEFASYEGRGVTFAAQWQRADGSTVGDPIALSPERPTKVRTPAGAEAGYLGLTIVGADGGTPIWRQTSGFAVLPKRSPTTRPIDSPFGLVHFDIGDSYLGGAWSKTLACDQFIDADKGVGRGADFRDAVQDRAKRGLIELPLLINANWWSDPTKPVEAEQLEKLKRQMTDLFKGSPQTLVYELGLEENLKYRGDRAKQPQFWPNLAAKAKAVREAADAVNPKIRLAYQIAEFDRDSVREFLDSDASKFFQILSIHPYAWAAFPMPDEWMPQYVEECRAMMKANNRSLAIWFTEIGAPHAGNPGGFFGYPDNGAYVNGLSPQDYASFLVRCNVVAIASGVEKTFWYNYRDGSQNPVWAEQHFGIVDVRCFPKPGYVAYAAMTRLLNGRQFIERRSNRGITTCVFRGDQDDCWVVWSDQPEAALPSGLRFTKACDAYGRELAQGEVTVGSSPLYLMVSR